jgi:hypothetical protein
MPRESGLYPMSMLSIEPPSAPLSRYNARTLTWRLAASTVAAVLGSSEFKLQNCHRLQNGDRLSRVQLAFPHETGQFVFSESRQFDPFRMLDDLAR